MEFGNTYTKSLKVEIDRAYSNKDGKIFPIGNFKISFNWTPIDQTVITGKSIIVVENGLLKFKIKRITSDWWMFKSLSPVLSHSISGFNSSDRDFHLEYYVFIWDNQDHVAEPFVLLPPVDIPPEEFEDPEEEEELEDPVLDPTIRVVEIREKIGDQITRKIFYNEIESEVFNQDQVRPENAGIYKGEFQRSHDFIPEVIQNNRGQNQVMKELKTNHSIVGYSSKWKHNEVHQRRSYVDVI